MIYNTLTQMKAKNLASGKYADGQGLWLIKRTQNAGNWILRICVNGKRREMGLGRWPDVSIAEAREKATDARRMVHGGLDPVEERIKRRQKAKLSKAVFKHGRPSSNRTARQDGGFHRYRSTSSQDW